jgi:hypothetical protein
MTIPKMPIAQVRLAHENRRPERMADDRHAGDDAQDATDQFPAPVRRSTNSETRSKMPMKHQMPTNNNSVNGVYSVSVNNDTDDHQRDAFKQDYHHRLGRRVSVGAAAAHCHVHLPSEAE